MILFGGYATQTVGLQYTSPSTSAFITGLYVIITPVIESAISRRPPRPPVVAGIVIATVGLYLLTGADVQLGRGEVLTLACAVLFALHIVYIGAYANLLRPMQFSALQIGAVALLSVAPAAEQGVGSLSALAVFAVVFTGIACSADRAPAPTVGATADPGDRGRAHPPGGTGVRRDRRVRERRAARRGAARGRDGDPGRDRRVGVLAPPPRVPRILRVGSDAMRSATA